MSIRHTLSFQIEEYYDMLRSLVMLCRDRYLRACLLLELPPPFSDREMCGLDREFDASKLQKAWLVLCRRYEKEGDKFANVHLDWWDDRDWLTYVNENLIPQLAHTDEFVRDLLRVYGFIPCTSIADSIANMEWHFNQVGLVWMAELIVIERAIRSLNTEN